MRRIAMLGVSLCVAWLLAITAYLWASHSKAKGIMVATGLRIVDGSGRERLSVQADGEGVRMTMLRPDGSTGLAFYVNEFDDEYLYRHSHADLFPDVNLPMIQIGAGTEGAGAVIAGKHLGVPRYARVGMFGDGSTRLFWVNLPAGREVSLPGYATTLSGEVGRAAPGGLWVAIDRNGRVHLGEAALDVLRTDK